MNFLFFNSAKTAES